MKLIDVHAHLTDEWFADVEDVLARAGENGVEKVITAGYDFSSSKQAVDLAERHAQIFATVGIHPENVEDFDEISIKNLKKLAKNEKVVAIGEVGLDYHFFDGMTEDEISKRKELQKQAFAEQINLANELGLPIVVHCRDAMGDTLELLEKNLPKMPSLMHCYSGSFESAEILIKMGFSFSFGGVVTFKNAKNVQALIPKLPFGRIMLETDCPYMTPEPFRGKRNEPKNVVYVADAIARLKETTFEEVAKVTSENAEKVFFSHGGRS